MYEVHRVGIILLDIAAAIVMFVALVRIVMTPSRLWPHGRLSKTAWFIASIWFVPQSRGVSWPLAAMAAIWHTRNLNRRAEQAPRVPDLPYAEGTADSARSEEES